MLFQQQRQTYWLECSAHLSSHWHDMMNRIFCGVSPNFLVSMHIRLMKTDNPVDSCMVSLISSKYIPGLLSRICKKKLLHVSQFLWGSARIFVCIVDISTFSRTNRHTFEQSWDKPRTGQQFGEHPGICKYSSTRFAIEVDLSKPLASLPLYRDLPPQCYCRETGQAMRDYMSHVLTWVTKCQMSLINKIHKHLPYQLAQTH